jgi:putative toxin-antitoxin system toxin component, PIN family
VANTFVVVLDCVVLVQGLISKSGPSVRCLELFDEGKIAVAVSRETLSEARDVLSRSGLRDRYPLLTDERTSDLIENLLYRGQFFRKVKKHFEYPRDPKDEPYINLAIEAGVDFIITRDSDLLDLMKWNTEDGREFQKRFPSLRILDPVAFLKLLDEQND